MSRRKIILSLILIVPVLLFFAAIAIRWYASTQVVPSLAQQYGGRVEADDVRVGWTELMLSGVRLYDADRQHVIAEIGQMRLNLTLWDLVRGRTVPTHLLIRQPQLVLRFDAGRNLLSSLPRSSSAAAALPKLLKIEQGSVLIEQEGRPATEIKAFTANVQTEGSAITVVGSLNSENWGQWSISGNVNSNNYAGTILAETKEFTATSQALIDLPLLPADLLKTVDFRAVIDARVAIESHTASDPHFHVEVNTSGASAHVAEIGLDLKNVSARAVLDDSLLSVSDFRASVANGTIGGTAQIDLNTSPSQISINASADQLHIAALPPAWSIPAETDGRVSGKANLTLGLDDSGLAGARGTGSLTIDQARIVGVAVEPIEIIIKDAPAVPGEREPLQIVSSHVRFQNVPLPPILQSVSKYGHFDTPDLGGDISADFQIEIPLATFKDPASFTITGTIASSRIAWQTIEATGCRAEFDLKRGILQISGVVRELFDERTTPIGCLRGQVTAGIWPPGNIDADLQADNLSLSAGSRLIDSNGPVAGSAVASLHASVPLPEAGDLANWEANGHLEIAHATFAGINASKLAAEFDAANGKLRLTTHDFIVAHARTSARAQIELMRPYEFDANFTFADADIAPLLELAKIQLAEPLEGNVSVSGTASGSLQPPRWRASGKANVADMQYGAWLATKGSTRWELDAQELTLTQVEITALGGAVEAEATWPLSAAGTFYAAGHFDHLQVHQLAASTRIIETPIQGEVGGRFSVAGPNLDSLDGEINFHGAQIRINHSWPGNLAGRVVLRSPNINYELGGDLLDGRVSATGSLSVRRGGALTLSGNNGRLRIEHLDLASVMPLIGPSESLPLAGNVDFNLDYSQAALAAQPTGKGRLLVHDLRWQNHLLARSIEADAFIDNDRLRLPDIVVPLGEGELRGELTLDLAPEPTGRFAIYLERVPVREFLVLTPDLDKDLHGLVNGQLHGRLGRLVSAGGTLGLPQGKANGIDVSGIRLPIRLTYSTQTGRGELTIDESTVHVGGGRVVAAARIVIDREISLASNLRLANVEIGALTHAAGDIGSLSAARASGNVGFSSNNFRTLNDLNASFNLSLENTKADSTPVLSTLVRGVLPMPPSTTFNEGNLRGRLSQGILEIQRLWLSGGDTRLMADGRATLSGRLDLNVVAQIGQMANRPLQRSLLLRVATPILAAEATPIALLLRANSLLANQLVFLHVAGTLHSPTAQVRPAPQLQYEALQFFLAGVVNPVQ